jgi:predicted RNase H-like HicB family nuclease
VEEGFCTSYTSSIGPIAINLSVKDTTRSRSFMLFRRNRIPSRDLWEIRLFKKARVGGAMYRFLIIIEEGEHNYSAYVPDLPGCVATGGTRE